MFRIMNERIKTIIGKHEDVISAMYNLFRKNKTHLRGGEKEFVENKGGVPR